MGVEQKRGDTKIFKRGGGKLGQGVGALKRGEDWNTLTNYDSDINFNGKDCSHFTCFKLFPYNSMTSYIPKRIRLCLNSL